MIEPTISIEANFVNMELERTMSFSTTRIGRAVLRITEFLLFELFK